MKHLTIRPALYGLAVAGSLLLAGPTALADDGAPPGAVHIGQFTTGGCVTVCETVAMCKNAYVNEKTGGCRLALDKAHTDFTSLVATCPDPANRTYGAEMTDGKWRLTCAAK